MQLSDQNDIEMQRQIIKYLNKNELYGILGVTKTSDQITIKNSYIKLAQKFHPNNNRCANSKQVFKKVSHAYLTLINNQKKGLYDKYGFKQYKKYEEKQNVYSHNSDQKQQQIYENTFRQYTRQQNVQTFVDNVNNERRQRQNRFSTSTLLMFAFSFLMLVLPKYLGLQGFYSQKPLYSLVETSKYIFHRKTSELNTNYYVNDKFNKKLGNDQIQLISFQRKIEREYIKNLKTSCNLSKQQQKSFRAQAMSSSNSAIKKQFNEKALLVDLSKCQQHEKLIQQNINYINELFQ